MPVLTRQEVEELALLARLALDDAEAERLRVELGAILEYMNVLAQVDTTGVVPMTHAVPLDLRLRPDEVQPSLSVGLVLAAAPARAEDGSFVVPNIIKTQGES